MNDSNTCDVDFLTKNSLTIVDVDWLASQSYKILARRLRDFPSLRLSLHHIIMETF